MIWSSRRFLGWAADLHDDGTLHLSHPLGETELHADDAQGMRRLLRARFAPESAFVEAVRQAPDNADDLAVVGDLVRVCRTTSPSARLPSPVLGVMADNGFIEDATYESFEGDTVVHDWWAPSPNGPSG